MMIKMKDLWAVFLAVSTSASVFAQPAAGTSNPPKQGKTKEHKELSKKLEGVLGRKIPLDRVHLYAHWANPNGPSSVRVYGNGVGIWNRQVQFNLSDKQILSLLKMIEKAKFTTWPKKFGGLVFKGPGPRPGVPEILKGQISLTIDGQSKSVTQLGNGKQSKKFAELAINLINACVEPAKKGNYAANLTDGLKKVAAKKLDPLTLSLLLHRIEGQGTGPNGWLMRVEGNRVTTRVKSKKGYGTKHHLELSRKRLEKLLKLLIDNQVDQLPINLYAKHYTDFRVGVLDKEKSLQARQFARMTPKTHGEKQKQFDRVFAVLEQLHQETMKKGKPAGNK